MSRLARRARAVSDGWNRFWFTPQPAATLALFRSAVGFTVLAWAASMAVDLEAFFGENGLKPDPTYATCEFGSREFGCRFGVFRWAESNLAISVMFAVTVLSAVGLVLGRYVKLAAPLMYYGVLSFHLDNLNLLNAGDDLIRIWALFFAIFALLTPSRFLSVPLFGNKTADGGREYPHAPSWVIRLAQIQMTIIYPASIIAKLDGDRWHDGTGSLFALALTDFQRFWVPGFLRESIIAGTILTWSTLAIEFSLPFLLWMKRTRRFGIAVGLGMHIGFDYAMRLGFFGWAVALGYVAFLKPNESARILGWLRGLFGSSSRTDATKPDPEHRDEQSLDGDVGGVDPPPPIETLEPAAQPVAMTDGGVELA